MPRGSLGEMAANLTSETGRTVTHNRANFRPAPQAYRGVSDQACPLFEHAPPGTVIWPLILPDTAMAVSAGAAPVTAPVTSTVTPDASRAEPSIVPDTDIDSTRRARTSEPVVAGTATVTSSPARDTITGYWPVTGVGVPPHSEIAVQKPFWHTGIPDEANARDRV